MAQYLMDGPFSHEKEYFFGSISSNPTSSTSSCAAHCFLEFKAKEKANHDLNSVQEVDA